MRNQKESGQVIVLLVVGIISLLGFSALAIDGARLFSEKRNLQGVSDTAAFTAATYVGQYEPYQIFTNWYSGSRIEPHAEQAALEIIRQNGYTDQIYNPFGGNDRLRITIDPITSGTEFTPYIVKVTLISEVDPIFAQLVYHGEILANAYTEAIVWPKMNAAYGRAIFSTATSGDKRIEFIGNATLNVTGSGIFANSNGSSAIYASGSVNVDIQGAVTSAGGIYNNNNIMIAQSFQSNAQTLPLMPVPTPEKCSSMATSVETFDAISGITWHTAGRYTSASTTVISSGHHVFESGWYCFDEQLHISGGIVESEPEGVMFYFPDSGNGFSASGGTIDLRAAQNGQADDSAGNNWDGMLVYIDPTNVGVFSVQGGTGSHLEGTIYAPGPASNDTDPKCSLSGSGTTDAYNVQLVCYSLSISGNAGLNLFYDDTKVYEAPVTINLEE
ncbi:MAG: pilus assembly protein TadG-related protein [Chloroflexota bacterium]